MPHTRHQPLDGTRVVDSTDGRGDLCARLLADLGADVVKVEPPGGALSRTFPPLGPDGTSLSFAVRNTNKRGVTADLRGESGRSYLDRLLTGADVWVDGHAPGALAELRLDHAELLERHPHLVIVSITDFGLTGPYRDFAATDDVLLSMAGLVARSGILGKPPLLAPGSLAYDTASTTGAFAALAALWQRRETGRGQHIDLSAFEAVAQVGDWSMVNYSHISATGGVYDEIRNGPGPVYRIFPCADGWVRTVIISTRQWHAMRAWLGEPEFLQDEHWDQLLARMSIQEDLLDDLYIELFKDQTSAELADEGQRRGVVIAPVLSPAEVLVTQHYLDRGTFADVEVTAGVRGPLASGFLEIDGMRAGYRLRGSRPGEHTGVVDWTGPDVRAEAVPTPAAEAAPPFAGLRVLDLGHGGVGVEVGRLLGEYGADVIKVETRTYPDFIRLVSGGLMSPSFASSNRCKRSLGLNAKKERGRAVLHRLVRWADVLIENASTGAMAALGLDYESLHRLNPRLVMVSSQLMGSEGPWKDWIGYGPITRAAGGMTYLWNFPDGSPPPGSAAIHPDHFVGRMCAVGAIAVLLARAEHGEGAHIEVAQVEAIVNLLSDVFLQEGLSPGSVSPMGNRSDRGAPWGVYQCSGEERWCTITVRDDDDWRRLREALGDPPWAQDPHFATVKGRLAMADQLDAHLSAWTAERSDEEVMRLLQAVGVPAGRVAYAGDICGDVHLAARGYLRPLDQPGLGRIMFEGPAFHSAAISTPRLSGAPLLAEHTREICLEILGMDDAEIDELVADGSLETS
ncbi:MAG: CoA transferase [Streptosporangiaceae bacterium]|nr:CoA transferase [Streptosporangiaceae bacterium]